MKLALLPTDPFTSLSSRTREYKAAAEKKFLDTFAEGRLNYWISFGSDSASAVFFLAWAVFVRPVSPAVAAVLFVAGFFLWTFSEYVFHRWAYHQKQGIFGAGHRRHHVDETGYVAMPWFVSAIAILTVWYVVVERLKQPEFSVLLAGWMTGFVLYSWVHHAHHHWSLRSAWIRRLRAHHRVHHRFPDRNFGVTTRFWDTVFGTRHTTRN